MLSPGCYARDLGNTPLGRLVHHTPRSPKQTQQLRERTELLWREMFPGAAWHITEIKVKCFSAKQNKTARTSSVVVGRGRGGL